MNSTTILFLKMFRDDLKRHVMNGVPQNASGDLMGSKIKMSEIEGLASYKLMNSHEKEILSSILLSMKQNGTNGVSKNKQLVKAIDGVAPYMFEGDYQNDYKDAA